MGWELVLPSGTRALNVEAKQAGGSAYPLFVEWDDTVSEVQVRYESDMLPRPLELVGKLDVVGQDNPFLAYSDFVQDLGNATAIRYYYDGSNYWERSLGGPIRVEVLRVTPGYIRWRVQLAALGDWLENGQQTAVRDWL